MRSPIFIPDVQGDAASLTNILTWLDSHGLLNEFCIGLLGDLVDGGYDARESMDIVAELVANGHRLIPGNHDIVLEMACWEEDPDMREAWAAAWLTGYEKNTLASYKLQRALSNPIATADAMRARLEELGHDRLIRNLPLFLEYGDYILVHTGLLPNVSWDEQRAYLLDRRNAIMDEAPQVFSGRLAASNVSIPGKCVVSGHVPFFDGPHITPSRAHLDCGAGYGGPLIAWIPDQDLVIKAAGNDPIKVTQL